MVKCSLVVCDFISDLTRTPQEQLDLINWQVIITRKEILRKKNGQICTQSFTIRGTLYLEISRTLREILLTNEMYSNMIDPKVNTCRNFN